MRAAIECFDRDRYPHIEFPSRAHVPPLGICRGRSTCGIPAPLVIDPLAFALRGEFYTYLCRACEADLEMEA
jgi:hypothetical protein